MRRVGGFTLFELLVVVAIMGLVMAVALPNLRLSGFASNAARTARQIASGLADARRQAIHTNRESAFIVDLAAHSYRVGGETAVSLTGVESLTLLTAERDAVSQSSGLIRFYADGSSDGGELTVKDGINEPVTVRVNWLTGRISLDD